MLFAKWNKSNVNCPIFKFFFDVMVLNVKMLGLRMHDGIFDQSCYSYYYIVLVLEKYLQCVVLEKDIISK